MAGCSLGWSALEERHMGGEEERWVQVWKCQPAVPVGRRIKWIWESAEDSLQVWTERWKRRGSACEGGEAGEVGGRSGQC